MKNKRKLILFGTLFSVLVFFAPRVLAQEVPNPNISNVSQVKLITIATVNIYDARIISQDGNKIRIGFDLYNRTDIQPGIKYSVELVKTEGEGDDETQTIVDEKVYDEKIYLGADQTASKEIEYMAPEYLSGDFSIWITSKNDKGLGFGTSEAGKISLKGNGQYVEIVDNLCVLTVRGEDNKTQYYPDQGVDISKNEILLANCRVKNNFSASVNAVPNFSIYYRDTYGEKVSETKQSPINFSAGEEKIITLEIPKAEKPQAYDAVLSFFDEKEKNVSSQAVLHYVVQGQSATIQNLILDKDYYQKGDLAKLSVLWDSSADAFWGARGKGTKDNVYNLDILIKSALGETCSKENNIVLDSKKNGPQVFDVAITKECANPEVVLSIKNEKGVVMDSSKYQVGNAAVKKNNVENVKKLLYIFSSILFLLVVIYVLIKKKTKFKSIKNIIFVLVFAFFTFGFCLGAKADTYTLPQGFMGSTFEIDLNKKSRVYEPGETIKVTTSVPYLRGCDNNVRHVTVNVSISGVGSATLLDGRYMQENCATTFPGMFGTICKKKAKGEASFSAQSVPGAYSADFSFYYYLNGAWDGGSASIPYKVKCRKPVSPTPSSNISPKIVGTGENFSVSCDYGVATNSVFATVGGGTCVFTGWSGKAAFFNCTA